MDGCPSRGGDSSDSYYASGDMLDMEDKAKFGLIRELCWICAESSETLLDGCKVKVTETVISLLYILKDNADL
jgi:hypothetical protein